MGQSQVRVKGQTIARQNPNPKLAWARCMQGLCKDSDQLADQSRNNSCWPNQIEARGNWKEVRSLKLHYSEGIIRSSNPVYNATHVQPGTGTCREPYRDPVII